MKTFNKLSKKVLSCILALVMVVCSLTTTLAVFAAEEATETTVAYEVTYGSPAIPMFKDEVIDLTAVNVQFTNGGEFVAGTDIVWKNGAREITTFTAEEVGITKLTATAAGLTQNVYVIANQEGDYNFYLVNENLTGADNFNTDEWIFGVTGDHVGNNPFTNRLYAVPTTTATSNSKVLFHNNTNTNMYDDPVGGNNSWNRVLRTDGCLANSMSVLFYKSDILKDFADYTIQYETVFRIANGDANTKARSYAERLGIIARADIDSAAAATLHTADSSNNTYYAISNGTSFIGSNGGLVLANHRYSGLEVARLSNPGGAGLVSYYTADHKYFGTSTANKNTTALFDSDDSTEKPTWEEYHKYNIGIERKAVKIKLSGQDIVYTLKAYGSDEEVTVLDTINNGNDIKSTTFAASANPNTQSAVSNDAFKSAVGEVSRGTVGFMVTGNTIAHAYFNLTVKLNVESAEDMPIFGIINEDTPGGDTPDDNTPIVVNPNSPAFGMYVNTQVSLANIYMTLNNGQEYVGSELNFELGDVSLADKASVNNADKTFAAFATGVYKVVVKNSDTSASANLYFVVNEEGDNNFYLVNENLTGAENFNSDEWIFGVTGEHVRDNPFTNKLYAVPTTTATSNSKLLFHNNTTTNMYDDPVGGNNSSDKVLRTDGCLANSMSVLFYKSDILKDFADYTIQYETVFRIANGDANTKARSYLERLGIIARADIDSAAAATLHTADSSNNAYYAISNGTSFIGSNGGLVLANHRYSGLEVARLSNPGATGLVSYYTADNKYFGTSTDGSRNTTALFDSDESTEQPTWEEYHKYNIGIERKAVKIKLSGQDIVYTLKSYGSDEEVTVLDTINNGNDIKSKTFATSANPNTQSAVSNDEFKSAVGEVSKGTIGFMVTGNTIAHAYFNLTVKLNDTEVVLPYTDCAKDTPVNGVLDLDAIAEIKDNNLVLDPAQTTAIVIDETATTGKIIPITTGKLTFTNGTDTLVINVVANSSNAYGATILVDSRFVITQLASGQFVFSTNVANAVIPGTFNATAAGGTSVMGYTVDSDGTTVEFTLDATEALLSLLTVTADFADSQADLEEVYTIGQQININNTALRFLTAVTTIKQNDNTANNVTTDAYTEIGAIMIPKDLLNGVAVNNDTVTRPATVEAGNAYSVAIAGAATNAQMVVFNSCASTHGYYTQFANTLENIPDDMKDVDITSVFYTIDAEGNIEYGPSVATSYTAVYNTVYPVATVTVSSSGSAETHKYENVRKYFIGGTTNDLDTDASTSSISYQVGEPITFMYVFQTNGKSQVLVSKDDPSANLYGSETNMGNNLVSSTTITHKVGDVYIYTTKMNTPGTVSMRLTAYDDSGAIIQVSGKTVKLETTALVGVDQLTQPMTTSADVSENDINTAYAAMKTSFANDADIAISALSADKSNVTDYLTTAQVGSVYEISNKVWLKCVNVSGNDRVFNYKFATNTDKGIEANATGGVFAYTDSTLRPATGTMVVDANALVASSAIMVSITYEGYGHNNGSSTGSSQGISVRMNTHGVDPLDAAGVTAVSNTAVANGGGKDFIVSESYKDYANYNKSYQYGILRRDYVALQVAEFLAGMNASGRTINTTVTGGSMGGWQSVVMSALDNTVDTVNVQIPWMCSVGAELTGDIKGWEQSYYANKWLFNSVNAAKYASVNNTNLKTVTINAGLSDFTSPPAGVMALYNTYNRADISKSVTYGQWYQHSSSFTYNGDNACTSTISYNAQ